jgi:hypothetical protein
MTAMLAVIKLYSRSVKYRPRVKKAISYQYQFSAVSFDPDSGDCRAEMR